MMTQRTIGQAKGRRGDWFADVMVPGRPTERVPRVHNPRRTGLAYDDPFAAPGAERWGSFIAGTQAAGRVILTSDKVATGADGKPAFTRDSYVAVWSIDRLRLEPSAEGYQHLRFRLVDRLVDLE